MNETILQTPTISMSVVDAGSGPLVLFCHGFPETKHAWRHQVAALAAAGYRAVAPDLRGYGGSDAPARADQYTVFHGVGDMVALLDALGEERAVIVGDDWGATIAWQAALLRPDRFRAVVALSVPMMGQPPVPPSQIFPRTDEALFYTLYFAEPGVAEAEFAADPRRTLSKLIHAASGEAGPRRQGDGTPNPWGMVSRATGLLASLPLMVRDRLEGLPHAVAVHSPPDVVCGAFDARRYRDRGDPGWQTWDPAQRAWSWRGSTDGLLPTTPIEIERFGGPLFLSHGTADRVWSVEMTRRLVARLERHGRTPEVHYYEGQDHIPGSEAENEHHEYLVGFLGRHLAV